ncbi:hypothetical protein NBRC111452_1267 [Companilactobacillus farciminis]|jgi:hypothetical protein|nr:hypothetical protein NBRC111452_1267 [Companilactobacillus farciminis]
MTKIAIQLDSDRNIIGTYMSPESGAVTQASFEGWTLVDSDPAFLNNESYLWTVRDDDSKLVHISTGKTPDEENRDNITELTKENLTNQMTGAQLQTAVTALTKSNLQLTLDNTQLKTDRDDLKNDNVTLHAAVTQLTTEVMNQQLKSNTDTTK